MKTDDNSQQCKQNEKQPMRTHKQTMQTTIGDKQLNKQKHANKHTAQPMYANKRFKHSI